MIGATERQLRYLDGHCDEVGNIKYVAFGYIRMHDLKLFCEKLQFTSGNMTVKVIECKVYLRVVLCGKLKFLHFW